MNPLPPAATTYGHDEYGLICAWHFRPDASPAPVAGGREALALLVVPSPDLLPGFRWLHMNLNQVGAAGWLERQGLVSESFLEALNEGSRSTRIERDGDPCSR